MTMWVAGVGGGGLMVSQMRMDIMGSGDKAAALGSTTHTHRGMAAFFQWHCPGPVRWNTSGWLQLSAGAGCMWSSIQGQQWFIVTTQTTYKMYIVVVYLSHAYQGQLLQQTVLL